MVEQCASHYPTGVGLGGPSARGPRQRARGSDAGLWGGMEHGLRADEGSDGQAKKIKNLDTSLQKSPPFAGQASLNIPEMGVDEDLGEQELSLHLLLGSKEALVCAEWDPREFEREASDFPSQGGAPDGSRRHGGGGVSTGGRIRRRGCLVGKDVVEIWWPASEEGGLEAEQGLPQRRRQDEVVFPLLI